MKRKILFFIPSMMGGGAERVFSLIINHLDREKFSPILAVVKKEGVFLNSLPDDIKIIEVEAKLMKFISHLIHSVFKVKMDVYFSIFTIPKVIKQIKPNVIFSTLPHLNIVIASVKFFTSKNISYIPRETSVPSVVNKNVRCAKLFDILYRTFYPKFDIIVCPSVHVKNDLMLNFKIPTKKLKVIHNPIDIDYIKKMSDEHITYFDKKKFNLLAVGRLDYTKGFDFLLKAFAKLKNNTFHLTIIGEGKDKDMLRNLSKDLKIDDKVSFLGFQQNPYVYMKQADIFILSSRFEGFPNVVLEANACGTPVIAFDSPGGIKEIITDGVNGIMVKYCDIEDLALTIERSRGMKFDKNRIIEIIKERFEINKIMKEYEKIFLFQI